MNIPKMCLQVLPSIPKGTVLKSGAVIETGIAGEGSQFKMLSFWNDSLDQDHNHSCNFLFSWMSKGMQLGNMLTFPVMNMFTQSKLHCFQQYFQTRGHRTEQQIEKSWSPGKPKKGKGNLKPSRCCLTPTLTQQLQPVQSMTSCCPSTSGGNQVLALYYKSAFFTVDSVLFVSSFSRYPFWVTKWDKPCLSPF